MGVQVDRFIDTLERAGSTAAIVPGVGTVAGAFKVAVGLIQITAAVACAILLFIPAIAIGEEGSLMEYCWTHIKHGAGNILAGLLEAIPLLGTVIAFQRDMDSRGSTERTPSAAGKFMPYQSLIDDDHQQNDLKNMPNDGLLDDAKHIVKISEEEEIVMKITAEERGFFQKMKMKKVLCDMLKIKYDSSDAMIKKAYYGMSRVLNKSQNPNAGEAIQVLNSLYTSTFNAPMKPSANPWEMVR